MAERSSSESSWFSWQTWGLLVAALAGGVSLLPPGPLNSSRPETKSPVESILIGDQMVEARLWQDPFAAVQGHLRSTGGGGGGSGNAQKTAGAAAAVTAPRRQAMADLAGQVKWRQDAGRGGVGLLGVMVEAAPYAEDAEARLRYRHAVLSALATQGFVPADPEHLGYLEMPWLRSRDVISPGDDGEVSDLPKPGEAPAAGGRHPRLLVPFEWLKRSTTGPGDRTRREDLLVLWLKDEAFEDLPLTRLAQFFENFRSEVHRLQPAPPGSYFLDLLSRALWDLGRRSLGEPARVRFEITILGPRKSATLEAMLAAGDRTDRRLAGSATTVRTALAGVRFISPFATAADPILIPGAAAGGRQATAAALANKGIQFLNAAVTDDELAGALVQELESRGVPLTDPDRPSCVALISEWDTLYGRALPRVFAAKIENKRKHAREDALSSFLEPTAAIDPRWPAGVNRFSYLRGLDGKLPGESDQKPRADATNAGGAQNGKRNLELLERPDGSSQLDYIPRLITRLREVEADSRRQGRGELRAIGVLGSDVYDKLLILQSLRPSFPRAIFFTTDLDARLLHPKELKWTRNLIVASGFGLRLRGDLQSSIPPFRDGYQTALFLACLAAVDQPAGEQAPAAAKREAVRRRLMQNNRDTLTPRVFEVGQRGEVDLSFHGDPCEIHPRRAAVRWLESVGWRDARNALLLLLSALAAGWVAWKQSAWVRAAVTFLVPVLRDGTEKRPPPNGARPWVLRTLTWAAIVLTAGYAGLILYDHSRPQGEPFSLFDGVSIWPTEVIRLGTILLSIGFLVRARYRLLENKAGLVKDFGLPGMEEPSLRAWWKQWKTEDRAKKVRLREWLATELPRLGKRVNAASLWRQYNRRGVVWARWWRIAPNAALYYFSALLLTATWGFPFRPFRGGVSALCDQVTVMIAVILLIALLFYIVDAARLCRGLIDKLTQEETLYSLATYKRFTKRWKLPPNLQDEWLDMQIIGRRTQAVGELIYFPFVILLLMIVSRSSFFDRWDWPPALILVLSINAALAIYSVFQLRAAAEKARRVSLERLRQKLVRVFHENSRPARAGAAPSRRGMPKNSAEEIRFLIAEIENYKQGAFAPLSHQPVVGALLMPFGGAGVLAVFEHLALN